MKDEYDFSGSKPLDPEAEFGYTPMMTAMLRLREENERLKDEIKRLKLLVEGDTTAFSDSPMGFDAPMPPPGFEPTPAEVDPPIEAMMKLQNETEVLWKLEKAIRQYFEWLNYKGSGHHDVGVGKELQRKLENAMAVAAEIR